MKLICAAAFAAAMLVGSAHAEKWVKIGDTSDGSTSMEIDIDTVTHLPNGDTTVKMQFGSHEGVFAYDCKGHAGSLGSAMKHIPEGTRQW
jgi:hypothetical protein